MDNKAIQSQIQHYLVKWELLEKQSRFMKSWRTRFVVLTRNYLFTFEGKQYQNPTDVINVSDIISVKSNTADPQNHQKQSFSISTYWHNFNFRCKDAPSKWNWLVALERVIDLKFRGSSTYNSPHDLFDKGLLSINQFNRSLPDGPHGKRLGANMVGLIQQIYNIGHSQFEKQKKIRSEQIQKKEQDQRKEKQTLETLESVVQKNTQAKQQNIQKKDEGVQSETTTQDLNQRQQKQETQQKNIQQKIFKIPSIVNGRLSEDNQKDQKNLDSQTRGTTQITQQMNYIEGKLFRKIHKITVIPVDTFEQITPTMEELKKSESKETQIIPKGIVQSVSKAYQKLIDQHNHDQQFYRNQEAKTQNKQFTNLRVDVQQTNNLRKSKLVIGIFDEFTESASPETLSILVELLVKLMCQNSCRFRNFIKFQCLNHRNKHHFAEVFTEHYTEKIDEQSIKQMLRFFSIVYPNSEDLWSQKQIFELKKNIKSQQILKLSMNNLRLLNSKNSLSKEQIQLVSETQKNIQNILSNTQGDVKQEESQQMSIVRQFRT